MIKPKRVQANLQTVPTPHESSQAPAPAEGWGVEFNGWKRNA